MNLNSLYAVELLRLIFAEDQAALYAEGFVVLSGHPYVRRQMNLLQDETNIQLLSILELFKIVDPEMNQCAEKLEAEVAGEMGVWIDAGNVIGTSDEELVKAAVRMQAYLVARYRRVIDLAGALGLAFDLARLEEMLKAKQARSKSIANSLGQESPRPTLTGRQEKSRGSFPVRRLFRTSLR